MLDLLTKNNPTQPNNATDTPARKDLRHLRKRIALRASLAVLTILLTLVIIFGMTAAWYTNVVQSGGLIFQVEQMGVNVDATISAATFTAKPGDTGVISLTAANQGQEPVDISVSINKASLNEEMQKRLYFYVDGAQTQNLETMERSYVTADTAYSYMVFGGNSLALTEQYHNAPQLKWCWVYDVLGYYVLGQAQNGTVKVQEYLRPIEYDYDRATFDPYGNLEKVDGSTTVEEFLLSVSESDGYYGNISVNSRVGDYYLVDVDENGYGVYAYLCTCQEIEENTDYDTVLGSLAMQGATETYSVLLTVDAQQTAFETVSVSTEDELFAALTATDTEKIELSSDISLSNPVTLYGGEDILLDLNGNTLTTAATGEYAFSMYENSSLTVTNGTVSGDYSSRGFLTQGAELTLHDVDLTGYEWGIYLGDQSSEADSAVTLTGCTIEASTGAIFISGNGTNSEQTTKLLIDNCVLMGGGYVISGNGTATGNGRWGTEIEVANSILKQPEGYTDISVGIFHPQKDSVLNVYNSAVYGYTGIAVKGGAVCITQSRIYGTGETHYTPTLTTSGFSDTADAIYVETGYGYDISLTISGSHAYCNAQGAKGLRIFEEDSELVTYIDDGTNTLQN